MRFYTPALTALLYMGTIERVVREVTYGRGEDVVKLDKDDILFVPHHVALLMKQRNPTGFKILTKEEAEALILSSDKHEDVVSTDATLENYKELDLKQIKEACKKRGIKIGHNKQDALIALLLPFLQQEANQD